MAERDEVKTEGVTYRYKESLYRSAVWCKRFFIGLLLLTLVSGLFNFDGSIPEPPIFMLMGGGFWCLLIWFSSWQIRSCEVTELTLGEEAIDYVGIKNQYHIPLKKVSSLQWRCWPNVTGSVVVRTHEVRLAIHFGNYEKDEQEAIVEYLRESVGERSQEGWREFVEMKHMVEVEKRRQKKQEREARAKLVGPTSKFMIGLKYFCGISGLGIFIGVILFGRKYLDNSELIHILGRTLLLLTGGLLIYFWAQIEIVRESDRDDDQEEK